MAIKTVEKSEEQKVTRRGEICKIAGKEYFVRAPKAKDMIALEDKFKNVTSAFSQGLLMVDHLCDEITYAELIELYVDDLTEVFEVFDKLLGTPTPDASIS